MQAAPQRPCRQAEEPQYARGPRRSARTPPPQRLLDNDCPIGTRDCVSGRRNGSALCILTGRKISPRARNGCSDCLQRSEGGLVRSAQDETDIGMGDEPTE